MEKREDFIKVAGINSALKCLMLLVLLGLVRSFIHLVAEPSWANSFHFLFFESFAGKNGTNFGSLLIAMLWGCIFAFSSSPLRKRTIKERISLCFVEAGIISSFFTIVGVILTGESVSWGLYFMGMLFLEIFLTVIKVPYYRKVLRGPLVIVLMGLVFAVCFGQLASLLTEAIYWIIAANILAYVLIIALGGSIYLEFGSISLNFDIFHMNQTDMYYGYVQGIFPFVMIGFVVGVLTLIGVNLYCNPENGLKHHLGITGCLSLLLVLIIVTTKVQFYFTFIGDMSVQGDLWFSLGSLWGLQWTLFALRHLFLLFKK